MVLCSQGASVASSNVPTMADLLAVDMFELDDWNYEEEEDTTAGVSKADIPEVSIPTDDQYQMHVKHSVIFWGHRRPFY